MDLKDKDKNLIVDEASKESLTEEIFVLSEDPETYEHKDVIDKSEIKHLNKRLRQVNANKDTLSFNDDSITIDNEGLEIYQSQVLSKREKTLLMRHYLRHQMVFDVLKVALCALLVTITFDYFISITGKTGLYPAGIGAFARFLSVITSDTISLQSSLYFIYYFAINIPLIAFGFIKLGKRFTLLTVLYIGLQIGFDQVIQHLPYINPTDFHVIVNYQLLNNNGISWNNSHWLFIFGLIAGLMLGFSYSIVYKLGSSTGGLDFVSVFLSTKFHKPVGALNKNINLVILFLVIMLNTAVMPISAINADIKIDVIMNGKVGSWDNASDELLKNLVTTYVNGMPNIIDEGDKVQLNDLLISFLGMGNEFVGTKEELINTILQTFKNNSGSVDPAINNHVFEQIVNGASLHGFDGKGLSSGDLFGIKVRFILGPSLFASLVLILSSGFATNLSFPKFKISTFVINTNKSKEINTRLLELGYTNDVLHWNGINHVNGNYIHTDMLMITMPVMEWTPIEKELFLIDPDIRINIISTTAVKGMFSYEVNKNQDRDIIIRNLHDNTGEIEKLKAIATVKYRKQLKQKLAKAKRK